MTPQLVENMVQWEQVAQESVASGDEEDDQISTDAESDDDALWSMATQSLSWGDGSWSSALPPVASDRTAFTLGQVGACWEGLWWAHMAQDLDTAALFLWENWMRTVTFLFYEPRGSRVLLAADRERSVCTPCLRECDIFLRKQWLGLNRSDSARLWTGPPFPNCNIAACASYIDGALNPLRSPFCQPQACGRCDDLREHLEDIEAGRRKQPLRLRVVRTMSASSAGAGAGPVWTAVPTVLEQRHDDVDVGVMHTWEHAAWPEAYPDVASRIVASTGRKKRRPTHSSRRKHKRE